MYWGERMNKILFCVSFFIFLLFCANTTIYSLAISIIVGFAGIAVFFVKKFQVKSFNSIFKEINDNKKNKKIFFLSVFISSIISCSFFYAWENNFELKKIIDTLHINSTVGLIIVYIIGLIFNFYFLYNFFTLYFSEIKTIISVQTNSADKLNYKQHIFIFIVAFVSITLLSTSSFLYPLNIWNDSNCFFTVGKSMLRGVIPYKDIFEQKGPLLYFLHALAALISYKTFFGVYIFEVIAAYVFLLFSYKTMCLFVDKKVICFLPILSFVVYSSYSFRYGDSAEEFCMPLIIYGLYVSLKSFKNKENISFKDALFVGITAGAVLWVKYSMLGFYVGWIILPAILMIRTKKIKELFKLVLQIALGVLIPSIVVLIYFAINNSLSDLFTVYFYDNIFLYSNAGSSSMLLNVIEGIYYAVINNRNAALFIVAGIIFMTIKKYNVINYLLMLVFTMMFIFMGAVSYGYYSLILSVFVPIGVAFCYDVLCKLKLTDKKSLKVIIHISQVAVCIILLVSGSNFYLIGTDKDNLVQYRFSEQINKVEDATLLNYGTLDIGVYTVSGIVPNNKYFAKLNINYEEMNKAQDECLKNKEVDFVVTRDQEINFDGYELVDEYDMYFTFKNFTYRLYQLVD